MTCSTEDGSCETPRRRGALAVLWLMTAIFVVLSVVSFLPSRGQVTPKEFTYRNYTADQGKRVFQAYNCMGCHTIVGNGAYLGPDLTKEYAKVGPAWLEAFLPSAASWPTAAVVSMHLSTPEQKKAAGVDSMDGYLKNFPGAAERIQRRGGSSSHMPNLPFTQDEVGKLIAFLKYTSAMNTEGWPPKIEVGGVDQRLQLAYGTPAAASVSAGVAAADSNERETDSADADPARHGAQLVQDYGCTACHATDSTRKVGPGWGGLYNHRVSLADGSSVTADEAYLARAIRQPDAQVVKGFPAGVMPAYGDQLADNEIDAIVAYLVSLGSAEKQ